MKNRLMVALCCALLAGAPLAAAKSGSAGDGKRSVRKEPTEKQLAHQKKMKACSRQAGEQRLKGEDRKRFMRACLRT